MFPPGADQGAGRGEGEDGGAGPSPRPPAGPAGASAREPRRAWPSRPGAPLASLARPEEAASAPPAGLFGGGEAAGQARNGLPARPGWEAERPRGQVSAQVGAGGAVWTARGRAGRAGAIHLRPGTAGGARLDSCWADSGWMRREKPQHSHPGHF